MRRRKRSGRNLFLRDLGLETTPIRAIRTGWLLITKSHCIERASFCQLYQVLDAIYLTSFLSHEGSSRRVLLSSEFLDTDAYAADCLVLAEDIGDLDRAAGGEFLARKGDTDGPEDNRILDTEFLGNTEKSGAD